MIKALERFAGRYGGETPADAPMGRVVGISVRQRALAIVLLAISVTVGVPSAARAIGTYTVFSCAAPNGGAAPAGNDRYGWQPQLSSYGRSSGCNVEVDHPQGADLIPVGEHARIDFRSPPATLITGWRLEIGGYIQHPDGGTQTAGEARLVSSSLGNGTDWRGSGFVPATWPQNGHLVIDRPDAVESTLSVVAACYGPSGARCPNASDQDPPVPVPWLVLFGMASSRVRLLDRASPTGGAAGTAISDAAWVGAEPMTWQATDEGGGIYRLGIELDGQTETYLPGPDNGGRCSDADPSNPDPYEFVLPVPCQLAASGAATIDTTRLPNGTHSVRVYVEDAGGNQTTIFGPAAKEIANDFRARGFYAAGRFFNPRLSSPRAVNGNGGGEGARIRARLSRRHRSGVRTRVAFGERVRVRGSIRSASGEPVRGALLFRAERVTGGDWRLDGAVHSRRDGSFTYLVDARRPSRDLALVYFPFSDSHDNVRSNELRIGVRAGLTIAVNRHRTHNGGRVVFRGRVLGPVPERGVAVSLQAMVGHHFQTFRQLRTTSLRGGRLRTVYRFTNTRRTARYRFRFKLVEQAGLPFETGTSKTVSVLVGP
jgi:hypothetical protein